MRYGDSACTGSQKKKKQRYPQSLSALSHTLLLNPQNPFHVLRAAETAYTAQDVPLALKFFLRAVEMMDEGADEPTGSGIVTRGWYGVKLVSKAYTFCRVLCRAQSELNILIFSPRSASDNYCTIRHFLRLRILLLLQSRTSRFLTNSQRSVSSLRTLLLLLPLFAPGPRSRKGNRREEWRIMVEVFLLMRGVLS
jgi:hypothetical protein